MAQLPPTPTGVPPGHSFWNDWYEKLRSLINNANLDVKWSNINDFNGSSLTDIETRNHDDLMSIGGVGTAHVPAYAEGTFTPTSYGTTAAGVATYTIQSGRYVRVGNVVHVYISVGWSAHTGTGNIRLGGLPFTSVAGITPPLTIISSNLTFANSLYCSVIGGSTDIELRTFSSAATTAAVAMDTSAGVVISGTYFI